jgi:hypothetical protein
MFRKNHLNIQAMRLHGHETLIVSKDGDARISSLREGARLADSDLVVFNDSGSLGLKYVPVSDGPGNEGFVIPQDKTVALLPGETPLAAYVREFKHVKLGHGQQLSKVVDADCGIEHEVWRRGSEEGFHRDLMAIVGHVARRHSLDIKLGQLMLFCHTGIPGSPPWIEMGIGEIVRIGDFVQFRGAAYEELVEELERLSPALFSRNYPVGCTGRGTVPEHYHFDKRFVLMFEEVREITAREAKDEEARYQELVAASASPPES